MHKISTKASNSDFAQYEPAKQKHSPIYFNEKVKTFTQISKSLKSIGITMLSVDWNMLSLCNRYSIQEFRMLSNWALIIARAKPLTCQVTTSIHLVLHIVTSQYRHECSDSLMPKLCQNQSYVRTRSYAAPGCITCPLWYSLTSEKQVAFGKQGPYKSVQGSKTILHPPPHLQPFYRAAWQTQQSFGSALWNQSGIKCHQSDPLNGTSHNLMIPNKIAFEK